MKISIPFILALNLMILGSFLIVSSCNDITCLNGNNQLGRNSQPITKEVTGISVLGDFTVFLVQNGGDSISIEAETNLIKEITAEVVGKTLQIGTRNNVCMNPSKPIIIRVYSKAIQSIALSGSGIIESDTLNQDAIDLTLSGSGNIKAPVKSKSLSVSLAGSGNMELWGQTSRSQLSISGSGNIETYGLDQDSCVIDISGSGNTYSYVRQKLDASISGSGSIFYKGNPETSTNVTGSGKVQKENSGGKHAYFPGGSLPSSPSRTLFMIY